MPTPFELLLPQPHSLTPLGGHLEIGPELAIAAASEAELAAAALDRWARQWGLAAHRSAGGVTLRIESRADLGPEAYRLRITSDGVDVLASDAAGLFYGVTTLGQWIHSAAERLPSGWRVPAVEIADQPSFAARGLMLDVSRNRVPRLRTLFELIDLLASLKINQLQLYTEHTFAYRGHEVVWESASPLTPAEIRRLDAHCADRFVELVPNQNSFGHFHRWLVHEPYRALAERPEGVRHAFGRSKEPFSLCAVDPRSLDLLEDLYGQLLPSFRSRMVNVGLDETFDLGTGRSRTACEERGKEEVYVDYLRRVQRLVSRWGHRMQFWGDIILTRPDLIGRLPSDVIALDWGYEASHPFDEECRRFAEAGLDFYVCPGTSSWCSLGGRLDNALGNLANAAGAGRRHGADGYLITDWGDFGHLQPLPVSYPGIVAGAARAWNAESEPTHLSELLTLHVPELAEEGLADALIALGRVPEATGVVLKNSTVLFHLLLGADRSLEHERFERLSEEGLRRAGDTLRRIETGLGPAPDSIAGREIRWVARMLRLACDLGIARLETGSGEPLASAPGPIRRALGAELELLTEELRGLWLERSRPGGLADSLRYLDRVKRALG